MLRWLQRAILVYIFVVPAVGFCQTGFYLTFPCKGGNSDLKRFDPTKGNLCLVASPILSLADIAAVSEITFNSGNTMFELRLTREGFERLKTAVRLSPVVAFIVDKEILFLFDTEKTELRDTIRIYQGNSPFNFYRLHELLQTEKQEG